MNTQQAEVFAWHFTRKDGTTVYLTEKEEVGTTYRVEGEIFPCRADGKANALHASVNPLDALRLGSGFHVKYCRMSGVIVYHADGDKLGASERTPLAEGNARDIVLLFAADCAERALLRERKAGREPDKCSWAAVEAVRAFVRGEIAAAADAARAAVDAADAAARAAAYAAYAAAYAAYAAKAADAAADAAAYAARAAAYAAYAAKAAKAADAADAAARAAADAAADAEKQWQEEELTRRLLAFLGAQKGRTA